MSEADEAAQRGFAVLEERAPETAALLENASPAVRAAAARVFTGSDFVIDALARDAQWLPRLLQQEATRFAAALPTPAVAGEEAEFMAQLRRWRRAELARIAWRDLSGWASLDETLLELSNAADAAIRAAHEFAWRQLCERHGAPGAVDPEAQHLIVIAMGKLGGQELNFSSDIDLVFLFDAHGETTGRQPLAHEEFFLRLGQRLIRCLDAPTAEGRVFRVDMRLRPFGGSGPLVASLAAFEDYLERQGRDWERYAWIKARAVTGAGRYAEAFRASVQPFVYRRYLDFGVFESLREMKALIEREVERRELQDNIKLGPGGIREIEFIVQSLQLIRGGSERRLQGASLLQALPRLAGARLLPAAVTAELGAAYGFLRRLENRLQMYADQQTHSLPADPVARARIAAAMDCAHWDELAAELERHRRNVRAHFAALVQPEGGERPAAAPIPQLLQGDDARAVVAAQLAGLGLSAGDAQAAAQLLHDLQGGALLRRLDEPGRRRLRALLAQWLQEVAPLPEALAVLRRLLRVAEAIGTRSAYFALLLESATARRRLVELARHGDFLTAQIAAWPLLLDELIDERLYERLPTRAELAAELDARLAGVEAGDEEQLVAELRSFQRAALFRVAVADLVRSLPLMVVSDRLTEIAELIVAQALRISWAFVTAQYGTPMCGDGAARRPVRICAVGYGKLGGIELGYGSDLDLVFLHDSTGERPETEGARSVDNQVFFVRFVQRVVHTLTMHSAAGRLYEVDMRLRPSGKGGMLITSIEAFEEYQRREAWTWEHQALLHARAVCGDAGLQQRFTELRARVLEQCVRRDTLRDEVRRMRERMRAELSAAKPGEIDLKQDPGGIADIEFLAQYWALRWAAEFPPVAWFSDTIRELESVASANLVPQATVDALTGAYRRYRERIHHRAIAGLDALVPAGEFSAERAAVSAIWRDTMEL
ncbi:MAG TPA: bifunctional [glutamate--ammonia ligase]-adenylyl-L-tyrosine phosphorylase/[glutamate--ammonia-ligase] adenylyltransferase [Steroidobacteraceae bacterium]|nr:bifunctional [glutamate--ammonia ligase]-adenylyl-L-tyrosine phosphorylase/[glutamate--ammonia-ligase] adenylyltransferase [Steroidobacteraceae bacterium]